MLVGKRFVEDRHTSPGINASEHRRKLTAYAKELRGIQR